MTAKAYTDKLLRTLQAAATPTDAELMARYMKYQFTFLGVKKTPRIEALKTCIGAYGLPEPGVLLEEVIRRCFASPYREMHYAALYLLEKSIRKLGPNHHQLLEELILTQSWWDTVDWIAKLAGLHFRHFPEMVPVIPDRWMDSKHMWLQRVAILFQLNYKEKTDRHLLFSYILRIADSREFFLQKAAGWALRQYARTDADAVRSFVRTHSLAALTRREALKHIGAG